MLQQGNPAFLCPCPVGIQLLRCHKALTPRGIYTARFTLPSACLLLPPCLALHPCLLSAPQWYTGMFHPPGQMESMLEKQRCGATCCAGLDSPSPAGKFLFPAPFPAIFLQGLPGILGGWMAMCCPHHHKYEHTNMSEDCIV